MTEWIIVAVIGVVLLFSAKKLPDMARGLGQSMRIFKAETKAMKEDDVEPPKPVEPARPVAPTTTTTPAESAAPVQTAATVQSAGTVPQSDPAPQEARRAE